MKQILFFATAEDILPILRLIDESSSLKYVRMGQFPSKADFRTFLSGADIPSIGKASADSAINCDSYLILEAQTPVQPRLIRTVNNVERFAIDQLLNPDSITFTPAGLRNDEAVLNGRLATASNSQISQDLMRQFHSAIKKTFPKVKAFFVGTRALHLLKQGKRLTISTQSPRELDLTMDF
jgi:hypothetical protein